MTLSIVAAVVVAGIFLALTYVLLFKSSGSNMPLAGRGVGLVLLAGELKVMAYLLSQTVAPVLASHWVNYGLVALAFVGIVLLMTGLGGGR